MNVKYYYFHHLVDFFLWFFFNFLLQLNSSYLARTFGNDIKLFEAVRPSWLVFRSFSISSSNICIYYMYIIFSPIKKKGEFRRLMFLNVADSKSPGFLCFPFFDPFCRDHQHEKLTKWDKSVKEGFFFKEQINQRTGYVTGGKKNKLDCSAGFLNSFFFPLVCVCDLVLFFGVN